MVPGAGRLRRRFVLVVGKGGVGKTTAAGALALSLADEGGTVHLLSTDPAHSLADLFGTDPAPEPTASPCTERLRVEELDAERRARSWIDRSRDDLLDLLDAGTYLQRDEAAAFLDLTLPGVDELAAALRLTDLAEDGPDRIVVDTAPSGHTLRLLASGDLLAGWVDALGAVREKGGAVVERLTRGRGSVPGARAVDELARRARTFDERVLGDAEAVVVTRAGRLEEAETGRVRKALEARGVPVAFVAVTGADGPDAEATDAEPGGADEAGAPVVPIPWREGLRGCEGLRSWGAAEGGRTAVGGAGAPPRPARAADRAPRGSGDGAPDPDPRVLGLLGSRDLLLFAGKGGVGKTTCAAAAALGLARTGAATLLSTDPAPSLADLLGRPVPPEGARIGSLRVRQLDAPAAFGRFRERYRDRIEEVFRGLGLADGARLDREVMAGLLDLAPPGVDEVFALTALLEEAEAGGAPRNGGAAGPVIVDPAATGHFVRLVAAPDLVLDWVRELLRVLGRFRAALGLGAVAEELLAFAKRLKALEARLRDSERTGVVVVTERGPLVEAETRRLREALREGGVPRLAVLVNRARPDRRDPEDAPAGTGGPRLRAPLRVPPPRGPDELEDFLADWRVEA